MDFSHLPKMEVKKKTKQTWYGVEVVDYFRTQFDIPEDGAYGYSAWLQKVKNASVSIVQAKKLVEIMKGKERWLRDTKGEELHRGKWMFNRFRYEIKEKGVDKYISSQS